MYSLQTKGVYNFKWVSYIKSILENCGLNYLWNNQTQINIIFLKRHVKQILVDQFFQSWHSDIINASKGEFYSIFKTEFGMERYLLKLSPVERINICRIRTSNLRIPIESGRWFGIPRSDRICPLCSLNHIGDEFHYLYICEHSEIVRLRQFYIPEYLSRNPNREKMKGHFSFCNVKVLKNLSKFIGKLQNFL